MDPIQKPPLLPSARVHIRHFGERDAEGPMIYIFADVLDELLLQASYRGDPCVAVLVGGHYMGPAGAYIEIQGFAETSWLERTRDAVSYLQRRHQALRQSLAAEAPGQQILGWSHGLPGSGARMDEETLLVHLTFFNLPHQVCLVSDPEAEAAGFYRRDRQGTIRNIGFKLIASQPEPEAPAAPPVREGETVVTNAGQIQETGSEAAVEATPRLDTPRGQGEDDE